MPATENYMVSILSSTAIATAAVALILLRIPQKQRWEGISRARWFLTATYGCLSAWGFFNLSEAKASTISTAILGIASCQALLFHHISTILLAPKSPSHRLVLTLPIIALATAVLLTADYFLPEQFPYFLAVALLPYSTQLLLHTRTFRKELRETTIQLENFYDEDVAYHVRPAKNLFYRALFIGILAAIAALHPQHQLVQNLFVCIYTLYYVYVSIALANQCIDADFFLRPTEACKSAEAGREAGQDDPAQAAEESGASKEEAPKETSAASPHDDVLRKALDEWVARREFTKVDINTDQVAEQLGVTRLQLSSYFKIHHHTTFRSWRLRQRLEYARQLIEENPDLQLSHLHELVGFNDRSNFHNEFRKLTGMTPQGYRNNLR